MKKRIFQLGTMVVIAVGVTASVLAAAQPGEYGEATFTASLSLYAPIAITTVQNLSFGHIPAGSSTEVTVSPDDADAAQFTASGDPSGNVVGSVTDSSITMSNGGSGSSNQITVDDWTYGGSMSSSGSASFGPDGTLSNLRVGGTANVSSTNEPGDYTGTATFRLTYV